MLRASLVVSVFALAFAVGCKKGENKAKPANPGWHVVESKSEKIRFEFPAEPKPPRSNNIAGAVLTVHQVRDTNNDFFQVQTMPLPPFFGELDDASLASGFDTATANMLAAMAADRSDDQRIDVLGMPGVEVRATGFNRDREFRIISRLFVSKERNMLYQMLMLRPGAELDPARAKTFFDSFALLP